MNVDLYILAAGMSTRMGSPKPLVELGGQTLLARVVQAARAAPVRSVAVVVGASGRRVQDEVQRLRARAVPSEHYRDGLASSIVSATRDAGARPEPADGLLLACCDQPYLTAGLLASLVEAAGANPGRAVACRYGGTLGIPSLFPRHFWAELLELHGDRGAKAVLSGARPAPLEIAWKAGLVNVNFREDLDRIDPSSLPEPDDPIMFPYGSG